MTKLITVYTVIACIAFASSANSITQDERMKWWREARFGMFIHWGLYSIPGGEWKGKDYGKECGGASAEWVMNRAAIPKDEYRKLTKQFNPVKFDAAEWVSLAKAAGMKYIVITAKHHDGFCLFDTDYTDYNVVDATPFKRDIIKEMADECRKQGIHFGVYYSQFQDWYHRGLRKNAGTLPISEYLEMVQNHLDELLTNYGDIAVLWFDTGSSNREEADRQGERVRELQPRTIICSRLYSRKVPENQRKYADFESLPDRKVASARVTGDTETCMTMRRNWGYDRDDNNWKSAKDIIERLVISSSRGVNFLLNIGPTPRGTFCPEEIERLKTIGKWMKANGESIYGTMPSPFDFDFSWGVITQKTNTLYLHVMQWPPEGVIFNGLISKPSKAYLPADPECKDLTVRQNREGHITTIKIPEQAPDPYDSVIVLKFDTPPEIDKDAAGEYHWTKSSGLKRN